jgi:arabinogalactan endo-1,4-beta-galactosidase
MKSSQSRCITLFLALVFIVTATGCQAKPSLEPTASQLPTKIASPIAAIPSAPTLTPTSTSTPRPTPTIPSRMEFHVNPIDGLSPDFIMGADVSMLSQIEIGGGKYYDYGVEGDCLEILRDHGVNWIRLRIWNDPTDEDGKPLGGGNNDLDRTVEIAARAKALDLKFLLDFHYSDWWADPGKQNMPKAWVGLDSDELNQAVYDYTAEVIQTLADAGAMPNMVQIGNEVNGGMMWPAGKTWSQGDEVVGGYDGFADLLKRGIQAVRDNDPNSDDPQERVRIAIHLADGGDNELYRTVFDALTERSVDFDVIGLSYYSFWHGPLENLISNMNDISERYQKDVVVLEAAYAYTLEDADGYPNFISGREQDIRGYKATVQGQATAIRDVMAAVAQVPNGRGLGIFYWEPEWIAVEGAGWATGQGNAWENLALFDFDGNALPSLNVFNLVRPESGGVSFEPLAMEVYATVIYVPLSEAPELPTTVEVVYSDDAIRNVAVAWDAYDPALLDEVGSFTLSGAVEGTDRRAVVTVYTGSPKNYVENPGFENGLTSWVVEGRSSAVDVSNELQNVHDGGYALHYWAEGAFEFTVSQTIRGLENGTYTLSAWIQGGGEDALQLYASDYGGDTLVVDFENTGWQEWQNPTIENIVVTNGQCTVGLRVVSDGGTWAFFDEVGLFQNE